MSPGGLNFRVRDGNGWNPSGVATGNFAQGKGKKSKVRPTFGFYLRAFYLATKLFLFRRADHVYQEQIMMLSLTAD